MLVHLGLPPKTRGLFERMKKKRMVRQDIQLDIVVAMAK
jgi:hypothetical protein